jgi:hypothetical protein
MKTIQIWWKSPLDKEVALRVPVSETCTWNDVFYEVRDAAANQVMNENVSEELHDDVYDMSRDIDDQREGYFLFNGANIGEAHLGRLKEGSMGVAWDWAQQVKRDDRISMVFDEPVNTPVRNIPCQGCGKRGARQRCSVCKTTYYCDAACAHDHWPVHEMECTVDGDFEDFALLGEEVREGDEDAFEALQEALHDRVDAALDDYDWKLVEEGERIEDALSNYQSIEAAVHYIAGQPHFETLDRLLTAMECELDEYVGELYAEDHMAHEYAHAQWQDAEALYRTLRDAPSVDKEVWDQAVEFIEVSASARRRAQRRRARTIQRQRRKAARAKKRVERKKKRAIRKVARERKKVERKKKRATKKAARKRKTVERKKKRATKKAVRLEKRTARKEKRAAKRTARKEKRTARTEKRRIKRETRKEKRRVRKGEKRRRKEERHARKEVKRDTRREPTSQLDEPSPSRRDRRAPPLFRSDGFRRSGRQPLPMQPQPMQPQPMIRPDDEPRDRPQPMIRPDDEPRDRPDIEPREATGRRRVELAQSVRRERETERQAEAALALALRKERIAEERAQRTPEDAQLQEEVELAEEATKLAKVRSDRAKETRFRAEQAAREEGVDVE